jgi:hypothetical protein
MTCSPARLEANRANAQKSTGPRTTEGKRNSRANALTHGLCSRVIVPESAELIAERTGDWFFPLKPQDEYQSWIVEKISICSLRIDRSERMERCLRERRSLKSELVWEDDLRLQVERLGGKIATRPAEILEELRGSPVGCDWLFSRWSMLAHAADSTPWTPEQVALAFNLLGTPLEFREGQKPGDILGFDGKVVESSASEPELARREIAGLIERREQVSPLDTVDRSLTEADLFDESNPELKKLRRYEGALHNRFRWYLSELRYISIHFKPDLDLTLRHMRPAQPVPAVEEPSPAAPAASASASAPASKKKFDRNAPWDVDCPHPPFEIEPHEMPKDGSKPNLFKILLTRQEKREKKAEANREARRRKAEKLRA